MFLLIGLQALSNKRKVLCIVFSFFGMLFLQETYAQKKMSKSVSLDIMSLNIRMNYTDDGPNNWQFRKKYMSDLIKWYQPDLLGVQEAYYPQYTDMRSLLPEYGTFGSEEGRQGAESVAVFYLKNKLLLVDSGTFWLSQTPEKQSLGWDASLRRTVTWGAFKIKNKGKKVYFFVTHFDHKGVRAREESAKLLLQKVYQIAGKHNAFITGDFNLRVDNVYYKILTNGYGIFPPFYDTKELSEKYFGTLWTLNNFGLTAVDKRPRIDYIFSNKKISVTSFHNRSDQRGDVYPSDHNPQIVTVIL